jgi:NADH-quinone oxidoreductase subunit N
MIAIITVFLAMFSSFLKKNDWSKQISLAGLVIAFLTILMRKQFAMNFDEFYSWNPLAIFMTSLSIFIAFFIVLNINNTDSQSENASIYSLLLFSLCGALLLFGYTNLLTLFLGIEIMSIPLYVLAASQKENRLSLEAGLKYFILGSFSTAFLLFGIAMIYGTFGSFGIQRILEIQKMGIPMPPYFHVGVLFVLIAILFKMALVPFHFWAPDVYEGSPTMITAYMSTIVKIAATISMYYLLNGFFAMAANTWMPYIILIVALSFIISSLMGLVQTNVKRLMAYSSISHASFILLTLLIALLFQNPTTITFYLLAYTVSGLLLFSVLNQVKNQEDISLDSLNGLISENKLAALGLGVAILSMAGIPSTGGFIAKWNVLANIYQMNKVVFATALVASAIGIVYYLKLINRIFFYPNTNKSLNFKSNLSLNSTIVIITLLIFALGIFPSFVLDLFKNFF